jgi:hypothetical protein
MINRAVPPQRVHWPCRSAVFASIAHLIQQARVRFGPLHLLEIQQSSSVNVPRLTMELCEIQLVRDGRNRNSNSERPVT